MTSFLKHVIIKVKINGVGAIVSVDTGSTNSYIREKFVEQNNLGLEKINFVANMTNTFLKTEICGFKFDLSQRVEQKSKVLCNAKF